MSNSNNRVLSIYKSRKTMMEFLEYQEYNTSEYENFTINEVDAMLSNNQLDMLLVNEKTQQKNYVKYYLEAKQIRPANLDRIIEDLYQIENILTKNDTLSIIIDDGPNETILVKLKFLFDHDGIFVVLHNIGRIQYNILHHQLVPECSILNEKEIDALKKKYNIANLNAQLPEISRFDPQALAMCVRPGQVCKFLRKSSTALTAEYYRICI